MNILLIGNGFDLAHGLPTKYTDFLKFVKVMKDITDKANNIMKNRNSNDNKGLLSKSELFDSIEWYGNSEAMKECIEKNFLSELAKSKDDYKIEELINNNIWIDYFLQCDMHGEENWIDFESEISNVIQSIDRDIKNDIEIYSLYDDLPLISNDSMFELVTEKDISCKQLIDRLLKDLDNLIASLEIYLADYVEKIKIDNLMTDIKELAPKIDKVVNFNYTHTYENFYPTKKELEVNHLHGEAKVNNSVEENNMVLGIDEYLTNDEQRKFIEFIGFKKFYQRIYKKTGCKYREWTDEIKSEYNEYLKVEDSVGSIKYLNDEDMINQETKVILEGKGGKHKLYIFGHSLDITDGDVLKDLILNENVYTTIFYFSREQNGQQIANLTKVIGEDELIRRTGGKNRTIEFVKQR
ncbi:AbiH family protein [Clostridium butyricum]|uniref:AbiH family protein n=1 Tax=Clostridium butyricum TaxID=1492 RepID=UPI00210247BC|nr:AbiH family protein [Clostridium butyricum]MCQ2012337.1 bacteriophage abortive infection AbiH family protein [Clostridium butyricum]MCQ2024704.1 bacteriophage abortive infection AbiH family protein [Clostridium butyricum]